MLTEEQIKKFLDEVSETEATPPAVNALITHALVCLSIIANSLREINGD